MPQLRSIIGRNHAIVVGGSLAGLLAARALSEHFARVTLIERDRFPTGVQSRRGVPQGRHGHGLLAGGYRAMERLYPGFGADLERAGAVPGDVIGSMRWYQFGGYKVKFQSGLGGVLMSRPLIESVVRSRTLALHNICACENASVANLRTNEDRSQVTGVTVEQNGSHDELDADLVVDATGRGSRSPAWLESLGYGRPAEERMDIGVGYTTRIFRRVDGDLNGDKGAVIAPTPPGETRVGFILAIEENRWIVSIGGWLGDHAPTDPDGFIEFARSLGRPDIYDVIKNAEPLSDIVVHKFPANLRRRYERMRRFPDAYLVTGDALCSFNPIYGQGMTVAAMQALTLEQCLREHSPKSEQGALARRFFKRAAKVIDTPWMLAAGEDFRYPSVTGKRPLGITLLHHYVQMLHRAARHDRVACRAFFDVANLLAPPGRLFRPDIILRVLRGGLRGGRAQSAHSTEASAE